MKDKIITITPFLIFLILWEITGRLELINPIFISFPSKVLEAGYGLFASGEIFPHILMSLKVFFSGFTIALILGVILGITIGSNSKLYKYSKSYVYTLNSIPKVAFIPIIILWFGVGFAAKTFIVFLMAFTPIIINTIDGARNTSTELLKMSKIFNANKIQTLLYIILPSSVPFIFSGARISVGKGMIGLVIAGMFGYGKGLGHLISDYGSNILTNKLFFVIILLVTLSLTIIRLISFIETKTVKWNK